MTTLRRCLTVAALALLALFAGVATAQSEDCMTKAGQFFNECADLDTSHIDDLRFQQDV